MKYFSSAVFLSVPHMPNAVPFLIDGTRSGFFGELFLKFEIGRCKTAEDNFDIWRFFVW